MHQDCTKIFYNASIYSMDRGNRTYKAMAVKDGRIEELDEDEIYRRYDRDHAEWIDLNGGTVLPAFSDSHVHAPGLAYDVLFNINLYNTYSKEDILDQIEKFIRNHPDHRIYYGRGFNAAYFEGEEAIKGPRKEHLDRICPNKPIILSDFGGNFLWMNTKAFEEYGITAGTISPGDGAVELDPESGGLWGILREGARILVPYQEFTDEQMYAAAEWFQDILLSYGYTSVFALRPPGTVEPRTTSFALFKLLEKSGRLKLRIQGARDMDCSGDIDEQLEEMKKLREEIDSDLIRFTTAKFFIDGVIESGTAYLLEPYGSGTGKEPGYRGTPVWESDLLAYAFRRCMEEGFQIHCHTIGDGAVRHALDAFEKAFGQMGIMTDILSYRNSLTHLQLVDSSDIGRMADLNIIAVVQPYWHYKSFPIWQQADFLLIGERAENEYPLASFEKAGVLLVSSSDYPVTPDPNPFTAIQTGVTRNACASETALKKPLADWDDPVSILNKEERVSVDTMLRSFTINAAFTRFEEEITGSLEKGKAADFVVVDRDPYRTDPLELETIRVVRTVFRGETVYQRNQKN